MTDAQIDNSGLREYFDQVFSRDAVQRLKPAPDPYCMVAESLGVEVGQVRLVAPIHGMWQGPCKPVVRRAFGEIRHGPEPDFRAPQRGRS